MPAHRGHRFELRHRVRVPVWARELLDRFRGQPLQHLLAVRQALRWVLEEVQHLIDTLEVQTDLDRVEVVNARAGP